MGQKGEEKHFFFATKRQMAIKIIYGTIHLPRISDRKYVLAKVVPLVRYKCLWSGQEKQKMSIKLNIT